MRGCIRRVQYLTTFRTTAPKRNRVRVGQWREIADMSFPRARRVSKRGPMRPAGFYLKTPLRGHLIQQRTGFAFYFNAGVLVGNVSCYRGDSLRGIPYGFDWAAFFF